MMNELPLPPMIAQPDELLFNDVEDAALELYKRAAEAEAQTEKAVRTVRAEMVEQMRSAHRLIATLAAERFEFDRLMARIAPELERRNSNDLLQFLVLFKRSWELRMRRASIEVVEFDDYSKPVGYGQTGRVKLYTLTKEVFIPGFLERDEGEREKPHEKYPWDGVSGVKPFREFAKTTTVGVY